jgi:hypothetical protein
MNSYSEQTFKLIKFYRRSLSSLLDENLKYNHSIDWIVLRCRPASLFPLHGTLFTARVGCRDTDKRLLLSFIGQFLLWKLFYTWDKHDEARIQFFLQQKHFSSIEFNEVEVQKKALSRSQSCQVCVVKISQLFFFSSHFFHLLKRETKTKNLQKSHHDV